LTYQRDLLDHSFYRRWVGGDLSIEELRDYACQYAYVVRALPRWLRNAATRNPDALAMLERHAVEEEGHIALWCIFGEALGLTEPGLTATVPNTATAELLRLGDELSRQPSGAGVAWALEAQTPAVSIEKPRGLKTHYGIDGQSGGEYFELHGSLDLVHSAELDGVIATLGADDRLEAQRTADEITNKLWDLLTSVERAA